MTGLGAGARAACTAAGLAGPLAPVRPGRGDILLVNNRRVATAGLVNALRPGVLAETRALRVVNPASTAAITADH